MTTSANTPYEAGKDYALNGANTDNCNFKWFATPESLAEWERGRDDIQVTTAAKKGDKPK